MQQVFFRQEYVTPSLFRFSLIFSSDRLYPYNGHTPHPFDSSGRVEKRETVLCSDEFFRQALSGWSYQICIIPIQGPVIFKKYYVTLIFFKNFQSLKGSEDPFDIKSTLALSQFMKYQRIGIT